MRFHQGGNRTAEADSAISGPAAGSGIYRHPDGCTQKPTSPSRLRVIPFGLGAQPLWGARRVRGRRPSSDHQVRMAWPIKRISRSSPSRLFGRRPMAYVASAKRWAQVHRQRWPHASSRGAISQAPQRQSDRQMERVDHFVGAVGLRQAIVGGGFRRRTVGGQLSGQVSTAVKAEIRNRNAGSGPRDPLRGASHRARRRDRLGMLDAQSRPDPGRHASSPSPSASHSRASARLAGAGTITSRRARYPTTRSGSK